MSATGSTRAVGVGRVLIVVYAILAIGATARSIFQIATRFDQAPLAYTLSAVAGVVYILATIALIGRGQTWYRIAWVTISFELLGVLVVGALSFIQPELFKHASVWSHFGQGYLFIPLVLPVLGMLWLRARRPSRDATAGEAS